jgi:hypothetical protein
VSEYAEFADEERMTYAPVRTQAQRIRELEAQLNASIMRWNSVPLAALRFIASAPCRQWDRAESDQAWAQLEAWLKEQPEGAYQGVQNASR